MNSRTRRLLRQRKYGTARHRNGRREGSQLVAAGLAVCARCGEPIEPGEPWDLGHDDRYPQNHSGPEHVKCNRGAPNRNVTSIAWS